MTEMKEICGMCSCGTKLDVRIKGPDKGDERKLWLLYGICEKETLVIMQAFFFDNEPLLNRDYFVDWKKKIVK